ncbi:hypothetical protein HMPREF0044_0286 [Gleimia coleocanis DSM 15436]|uniref:Uncharacterized protein n=1 Tax=Gleimia coleocanis DSM 15436 TaxID=525245 RepID=C0VYP6_9ACTO|nr:hypothetical protein HMPREF0044_0286 [Gleimia coleocanis DSM 15436]
MHKPELLGYATIVFLKRTAPTIVISSVTHGLVYYLLLPRPIRYF